jgi:hypothetical protein
LRLLNASSLLPTSFLDNPRTARQAARLKSSALKAFVRLATPLSVLLGDQPRLRLLLARANRKVGNHIEAFAILSGARGSDNRALLYELSQLYFFDAQSERARDLLTSDVLDHRALMLRARIETESGLLAHGADSLRELMTCRGEYIGRIARSVNIQACHYPALWPDVTAFRDVVRDAVLHDSGSMSISARIKLALHSCMVEEARVVHQQALARGQSIEPGIRAFYSAVVERIDPIRKFTEAAWHNEPGRNTTFLGFEGDRRVTIDRDRYDRHRVVEFFIPPAFYRHPAKELGNVAAIRQFFRVLLARVASHERAILVPRHQFNWRSCNPLLDGRVISYHTKGEGDGRHLRMQEGALAGYSTLDHAGYAGFSSVATDHDQVRRFVSNVPLEDLLRNQRALYESVVSRNKSKYAQSSSMERIPSPYIFVALQVATDVVAELAWMSGIDLLKHLVRLYEGRGTTVVVKRHPYCQSMTVQAVLRELEHAGKIVVSKASIHDLIAGSEAVFTVNSGVGLEALIHRKPVVVSGRCEYSYAATLVSDAGDLESLIAAGIPNDERRALEFLYFYTRQYAFTLNDLARLERRIDDWLKADLRHNREAAPA